MQKTYYSDRYPNLGDLAAFFHEDWICDHESTDDVLRFAIDRLSVEHRKRIVADLKEFLTLQLPDTELEQIVWRDLLLNYIPTAGGWESMRVWLNHVLDVFRASLLTDGHDSVSIPMPPE